MGPDIWSIEAILTVCAWAEVSASRPQAAASHGQRAILKFVVILSPVWEGRSLGFRSAGRAGLKKF